VLHRRNGKSRIELFNLSTDPNETMNRATEEGPRVAAMLKALSCEEDLDDDALPRDTKPKRP
jgi:hypothetical protein